MEMFKFLLGISLICLLSAIITTVTCSAHVFETKFLNKLSNNKTTAWPQEGFDAMHSNRVPFTIDHSDFVANLSIPFSQNILPEKSLIFHTTLQKLIMPIIQIYSKPNVQIIYLIGFYLIDATNGKVEQTSFQIETRYSIEQNIMLDSKGFLYIPVYDNVRKETCLLKVNTWNWSSYSITPFTSSYSQVSSVLSESNNCFVFLSSKWISCIDLDNPRSNRWNITLPEEPYGISSMLIANENNQDVVYVALVSTIMKISVSNGKFKSVNLGNAQIASISHMGLNGFLSFSFSSNTKSTSFGVIHVDSGHYNSMEHFGITGVEYTVSYTFLDHSLLSSYVFKTLVFSSEARTTERSIHIYTTLVHVSSDTNVKISKPFAFFGTDLNTREHVPRASITKDNSKIIYYIQGKYFIFDMASGKVQNTIPSQFSGYARVLTADNGKVYGLVDFGKLGFESHQVNA